MSREQVLEVRLLGPVELARGAQPTRVSGARRPLLLALLALECGRVIPVDDLVEGIWDVPPRAPRHALEELVSSLRPVLDPIPIANRGGGYVLEAEPATVDVTQFRDLVEQARLSSDRRAPLLFRSALALRRGKPLGNCMSSRRGQALAAALTEEVTAALLQSFDLELRVGRPESIVAGLKVLVEAEPFREDFRAQLTRALYLCGRQTEALSTLREGRRLLDHSQGLEPGTELRALEVAILRHDTDGVRGAAVQRTAPAGAQPEQLSRMWRTAVRERDTNAFARIDEAAAAIEGALSEALAAADDAAALRIVGGMWFYWILRCQGQAFYADLRELALRSRPPDGDDEALGVIGLSELARESGDLGPSKALKGEALAYFRENGGLETVAALTSDLAAIAAQEGDDAGARELAEEGLRLRRETGGSVGVAHGLLALGVVHWRAGRNDEARVVFEEAAALYESEERLGEAAFVRVRHLAPILRAAGEHGRAYGLFHTGLRQAEAIDDGATKAVAKHGLAWIAMERRDLLAAARLFAEGGSKDVLATLTAEERATFADDVARLRKLLPPDDFAAAWRVGSSAAGH